MRPDVSVIIPAYHAAATIGRAARSVLGEQGIDAELVVCADDDEDYGALLSPMLSARARLTLCRTAAPGRGPSSARNLALRHASAEIIACLDADDAFAPGRLHALIPLADRYGVATGPTLEIEPGGKVARIARPHGCAQRLGIEEICSLRMPFAPVFHRRLGIGWAPVAFAEDVILNIDLYCAAADYPFQPGADYLYYRRPESRSAASDALCQAHTGYVEILKLVDARGWPEAVRDVVRRTFSEDLANVERAKAAGRAGASWREVVRTTAPHTGTRYGGREPDQEA